jgi:RimJ/RimL family protein N-acetyltransferase
MERSVRCGRSVISVRRLTVDDLAAFRDLHRLGLTESPGAFVESLEEYALQSDLEIEAMLARDEGWGAFLGAKLVAKLSIDSLPYAMMAHTRWIHGMYAAPEARGAVGGGAAVLRAAMDDARSRGATRVSLWVNGENARAQRFYQKLGFVEAGRVPGGLRIAGASIDDVMMCLSLDRDERAV